MEKESETTRTLKDCDFSYFSDLECESESKSDTSDSFVYCDDSGWQKVGVGDGLKVMVLQQLAQDQKYI
jgi:hypothetical protein